MAKNMKRILAMLLVMVMFVSVLPMQALAADGDGITYETSPEGLQTTVTTTTTGEGTPVVTVTIQKDTEGTLESGAELERHETFVETTETDENGNVIRETGVNEGNEIISNIIPEVGVEVAVPDEVGEENANSKEFGVASEIVDGDKKEGEDDPEYHQITTTVVPGEVTITTTKKELTEVVDHESTDLKYVKSEATPDGTNDIIHHPDGLAPEEYLPGYEGDAVTPDLVEGYDYLYVGAGNTSMLVPARVFDTPLSREDKIAQYGNDAFINVGLGAINFDYYMKWLDESERESIAYDENGNYVTDGEGYILNKDGDRIVKGERTATDPDGNTTYLHRFDNFYVNNTTRVEGWYEDGEWVEPINGKGYIAMWDGPQQYILVDEEGNIITTYCADQATPTEGGFGYNIANLENAGYYSEEEAKHIRSIAANGYWGTAEDEGSLEYLKEQLKAAGFTDVELASLNDGVALTATQMAIWAYSNKMSGIKFVNNHYSEWGATTENDGKVPTDKEDEIKLVFRIYEYLINLEGTDVSNKMNDTVITKDNAIENMNVTVIEKAADHANNQDDNDNNDAYVASLSFALVVEPTGDKEESLKVTLITSDGREIIGRICGEKESDNEIQLQMDDNKNYWFRDIVLIEGEQSFTLNLEGVQNLDKGVYLYSSEIRTDGDDSTSSQTLVGVASGTRGFDVTLDLKFDLDVQDQVIVQERVWRNEYDPETTPPSPPELPNDPPVVWNRPPVTQLANDEVEIPEEPVPLAAPVTTGDTTSLWIIAMMVIVCGMVVVNVFDKKRNYEAF